VWSASADVKPVLVTASAPALGISATATARPVSVTIDPGTSDATVFPAGGRCAISTKGRFGTPYRSGDQGENPACGVTYLRASGSTPYQLRVTVRWRVSWHATDGSAGLKLPDGTFGETLDMAVGEMQTVNR
jgi:enoyl reductase